MKSITSRNNAFRIQKRKQLMKSHQNPIMRTEKCKTKGNKLWANVWDGPASWCAMEPMS